MRQLFALLLIVQALIYSCSYTVPNETFRYHSYSLRNKKVSVIPFKIDPHSATSINLSFVKSLPKEFAFDITSYFHKKGYRFIDTRKSYKGRDYVLSGFITQIEGGNLAQRAWLGFGYGATIVTVRGFLIDVHNTRKVIEFRITVSDSWTYNDNESAVRLILNKIAKEIVNIVISEEIN